MKKQCLFLTLILVFLSIGAFDTIFSCGAYKSRVERKNDGRGVSEATLHLPDLDRTVKTDSRGDFTFKHLPYGDHLLIVSKDGYYTDTSTITVDSNYSCNWVYYYSTEYIKLINEGPYSQVLTADTTYFHVYHLGDTTSYFPISTVITAKVYDYNDNLCQDATGFIEFSTWDRYNWGGRIESINPASLSNGIVTVVFVPDVNNVMIRILGEFRIYSECVEYNILNIPYGFLPIPYRNIN